MVIPGMIQLSRLAVLPCMSWGSGILTIQGASHYQNQSRRGSNPPPSALKADFLPLDCARSYICFYHNRDFYEKLLHWVYSIFVWNLSEMLGLPSPEQTFQITNFQGVFL